MQYDIFSVGDNVGDYYPSQKKIYAGGSAYNTAVNVRRLGKKSAYYGTFGTDDIAKFLYEVLRKEKVAYPINDIREGRNAVAIIKKEGEESIVEKIDKGVYKGLKIGSAALELIQNSKIVHSNVYSYFENYLKKIKNKTIISYDFSHFRNKEYIEEIIKYVDIAFFSKPEKEEDPEDFINWAYGLGPDAVILSQGKAGAYMKYNDKLVKKDALSKEIVDTLGAGDAFIAGFLTTYLDFEDYETAFESAVKNAAKNCRIDGSLGVSQIMEREIKIYKDYHQDYI
jgi:fructoselysine 6-kinase